MAVITFVNQHSAEVAVKVVFSSTGHTNFEIAANQSEPIDVLIGETVNWGWNPSDEGAVNETPCNAAAGETVLIGALSASCRG